jgi:hypothetical protein
MKNIDLTDTAYDILSWVQSACSDLANQDEAEAERLYEDKNTLIDLIMQKAYDDANGDPNIKMKIVKELHDITYHPVIKEICKECMNGRALWIK